MSRQEKVDRLRRFVKKRGVTTRPELMAEMGCSSATMVKLIRQAGVSSSINCNGRFYTLLDGVELDEYGICEIDGIRFSREGSLTKTVVAAVERSDAGMTRREIEEIFGAVALPSLTRLRKKGTLATVKFGRALVYFAAAAERRSLQEQRRRQEILFSQPVDPQLVIAVLVAVIEHPKASKGEILQELYHKGVSLDADTMDRLWNEYDLKKRALQGVD